MAGVQVKFYDSVIDEMLHGPNGPVAMDIQRRTLKVHAAAVAGCPVRTGRLRSSIRWRIVVEGGRIAGIVSTDMDYARWVHDGTSAHKIRPRTKKALWWRGAYHPVRGEVNHPGTRARPFLTDALKAAA